MTGVPANRALVGGGRRRRRPGRACGASATPCRRGPSGTTVPAARWPGPIPTSGLSFACLTNGLDRHLLIRQWRREPAGLLLHGGVVVADGRPRRRDGHETTVGDGRILPLHGDPDGAHRTSSAIIVIDPRTWSAGTSSSGSSTSSRPAAPAPAVPPPPGRGPVRPSTTRCGSRTRTSTSTNHMHRTVTWPAPAACRSWPSWSATSPAGPSTGPGRCGRCGWSRAARRAGSPSSPRCTTRPSTGSPAPT